MIDRLAWGVRVLVPALSALASACFGIAAIAAEVVSDRLLSPTSFSIPAQPLGLSLTQFAEQAGIQILFEEQVVQGLDGPAIRTRQSAVRALDELLKGTGLEYAVQDETVAVRRKPAAGAGIEGAGAARLSIEHANGVAWPETARLAQAGTAGQVSDTAAPAQPRPATAVYGQEASPQLEEVIVTGSNIRLRSAADKGALPISIISEAQIKQTSRESIGDVLRSQPIVSGFNTTAANDEYNGGNSSANLRGIGDQYTLVLVNGRRFGGEDVPDLGAIPTEAIESVEILKNGASAVFGSDAVAGVVNVKLKDDFEGLEFTTSYGNTTNHDQSFKRAAVIGGWSSDRLSMVGSLSWQDRNGIDKQDREISSSRDFRPYGGIDRRSGFALIPNQIFMPDGSALSIDISRFGPGETGANPVDYVTPVEDQKWSGNEIGMYPPYRRVSGHWAVEYDVMDERLRIFTEGYADRRDQRFTYVAAQTFVDVPASNPYNPFGQDVSVYYQFGPDELPLLYSDYETDNLHGTAGVRGDIGDYYYELAYTHYDKQVDSKNHNDVVYASAQEAVERTDASALNVFGYWANSAEQLAGLTTVSGLQIGNSVDSIEGRVSGPLFSIPSGSVNFAAGAAHREVDYSYVPDEVWRTVETYWSGLNPEIRRGSREVDSAYLELLVPLIGESDTGTVNALELGGAIRYEDYSDFGDATVGQLNGRLVMLDGSLMFRASYAQAFKAPSVENLTTPATSSTLQGLFDPFFGAVAPVVVIDGGNPDLSPEEADTYSFGVVYTPGNSGLLLKMDYWQIDLTDLVDFPSPQDVLFGTSPIGGLTRDPVTGQATVDARLDNGGDRDASGIDFGVAYAVETTNAGRFTFDLQATHVLKLETIFGDSVTDHLEDGGLGVTPEWRSLLGTYWERSGWDASFLLHFSQGVPDQFGTLPPRTTDDYWTGDVQLAYRFGERDQASGGWLRNTRIYAGVENVWDEDIPFMLAFSDGFDRSIVDYRGRYWYMGIDVGF